MFEKSIYFSKEGGRHEHLPRIFFICLLEAPTQLAPRSGFLFHFSLQKRVQPRAAVERIPLWSGKDPWTNPPFLGSCHGILSCRPLHGAFRKLQDSGFGTENTSEAFGDSLGVCLFWETLGQKLVFCGKPKRSSHVWGGSPIPILTEPVWMANSLGPVAQWPQTSERAGFWG